jgi:Protein of unknown function (DUF3309)
MHRHAAGACAAVWREDGLTAECNVTDNRPRGERVKRRNEIITIVIVVLVLMLVGVLPTWPHSASWGYYPSGGLSIVLLVLVILALTGRLGGRSTE